MFQWLSLGDLLNCSSRRQPFCRQFDCDNSYFQRVNYCCSVLTWIWPMETLIYCLCGRIAKLPCRAVRYSEWIRIVSIRSIYRNLNISLYMPRFLRSVRLALHPAQAINPDISYGFVARRRKRAWIAYSRPSQHKAALRQKSS